MSNALSFFTFTFVTERVRITTDTPSHINNHSFFLPKFDGKSVKVLKHQRHSILKPDHQTSLFAPTSNEFSEKIIWFYHRNLLSKTPCFFELTRKGLNTFTVIYWNSKLMIPSLILFQTHRQAQKCSSLAN